MPSVRVSSASNVPNPPPAPSRRSLNSLAFSVSQPVTSERSRWVFQRDYDLLQGLLILSDLGAQSMCERAEVLAGILSSY